MSRATLIHDLRVQEITTFTPSGTMQKKIRYTYFLGNNGPFTLDYDSGQDSPPVVNAAIDAQIGRLIATGAVSAADAA